MIINLEWDFDMVTIPEIRETLMQMNLEIGEQFAGFDKAFPDSDLTEKNMKGDWALFLEGMRQFCDFAEQIQKNDPTHKELYDRSYEEAQNKIMTHKKSSLVSGVPEYKNQKEDFAGENEKWMGYGFYAAVRLFSYSTINEEAKQSVKQIFHNPRDSIWELDKWERAASADALHVIKWMRNASLDNGFF